MTKIPRPKPLALIILDGFGYREQTDANAIAAAHKPHWDRLWQTCAHTLISGSGRCVGLPEGQMGNSEVGHLNMGAGRIVHQDLTRIDLAIETGDFFQNAVLVNAINQAKKTQKAVHLMGLLSAGGVHSHERHIQAVVRLAAKLNLPSLYIHAFLDGRDTPPRSAKSSLLALDAVCREVQCGRIVSLIGRYYAMDRDKRWERIHPAYDLMVQGKADFHATTAIEGLELAYLRGESDEFVHATSIHPADAPPVTMNDGDVLLFMNFRADRAREITQAFIDADFHGFVREKWPHLGQFVSLSEYDSRFSTPVAFPPQPLNHILAECLSHQGFKQLRIAETEKYAHVTFFFNGGVEPPYPGEDRILIPSPKVATYDLQPEMSAPELTERLVNEIKTGQYDVIVCNFANPDMVGHTGNFEATVKAIETIDQCLGKIIKTLREAGGEAIITADHGNAEQMFDYKTNQPHTAHTADPVPFIYVGRPAEIVKYDGKLSDIAPTLLYLMGLRKPSEMTGESIIKLV
ncbi:2,3-bisphosphoglycerate-independent phosphoglycerate mutase [Aquicella lusitana]|uniref:2,3-bisphosphoglycerate-independent phosphoglycerate mutase n=1 Tax=Aquicella lusitana TaxID=254246 RepID=A0A370GF24_9COXI|nr:2,3-bisphosphoglycerate-independent phosphoglycerate mutase [Aquicella lusitana]RDI41709.1 phosphoglycerate mutase [Aquicella lusitana]VVC72685.1 2,3-bisphosphoglycerate-independent phosphoglycerate mutase [Aquicella lusitana]